MKFHVTTPGTIEQILNPARVVLVQPNERVVVAVGGTTQDLADHIASTTPHMAASSGLDIGLIYDNGRI